MITLIFFIFFVRLIQTMSIHNPLEVSVYFGVPGSGKTTYAAYLARSVCRHAWPVRFAWWLIWHWPNWCKRSPRRWLHHCYLADWILSSPFALSAYRQDCWSNVPIVGTYQMDVQQDLGVLHMSSGKVIIDEAGIDLNNRSRGALSQAAIKYLKLHRHYGVSVDVFSQSHEDMDITLRRLAKNYYVVRKSILPRFITIKRIKRKIDIDRDNHIADTYYWGLPILDTKWIYAPSLWMMFDSYSHDVLPNNIQRYWS